MSTTIDQSVNKNYKKRNGKIPVNVLKIMPFEGPLLPSIRGGVL